MITKVAFVGQPTFDQDRAKAFYGELLGLHLDHEHGPKWTEFSTPDGVAIALDGFSLETQETPSPYLALEVDDLEAEVARLQAAGVTFVMPMQINRNPEDREICRMAIILDPDGNPVMLHQKAAWRDAADGA